MCSSNKIISPNFEVKIKQLKLVCGSDYSQWLNSTQNVECIKQIKKDDMSKQIY